MTDKTPIQFGDDDRQLLRQIAGLVQEIHFRQSALEEKVTGLEAKVDEHLHDTRPMWESVNNRLTGIEGRFDRLEARLSTFETELRRDVRELSSIIRHYQRDTSRWIGEFEDRLDNLESDRTK